MPPRSWVDPQTHYLEAIDSDWYKTVTKLLTQFVNVTNDFYRSEGIDFALLPLTTGAVSSPMGLGSDSSPVEIEIDGVHTYLADSMQFLLEYMTRMTDKGAYYIAPSFRGEKADSLHLSQFFHSEAEIQGTLDDLISLVEKYVKHLVNDYVTNSSDMIRKITGDISHLKDLLELGSIPRCTFEEATRLLDNNEEYIIHHKGYRTISHIGELKLIENFGGFVWLTHYDFLSVPFYQKSTDDYKTAVCADLLMGIGETVGAGERHPDGDSAKKALELHEVTPDEYKWYVEMKDAYPMTTSGFGMGIERFLLWLLKHDDIRDIPLIPRFNSVRTEI